jgi:SOS-response transcriptional repressor LexA
MKTVGELIRERREGLGLTLAAVADEAGLTKSYLSMIENHKVENPPSKKALEELEKALRTEPGELMRAADWENTPPDLRARLETAEEQARRGRELASWLKDAKKEGGKNLDKLFASGELAKRVNAALRRGDDAAPEPAAREAQEAARLKLGSRVPLINRVAAGYPTDFTDLGYPARVADEYLACPDLGDLNAFATRVVGESMLPEYSEGDIVVFSPAAKVVDGSDCFVRLEPDHQTTFKRIFFEKAGRKQRIRLQPLNPKFPPSVYDRDRVAGLYRAVWRMQKV